MVFTGDHPVSPFPDVIREGDSVVVQGGGLHKIMVAKQLGTFRVGRAGSVLLQSLIGLRYGDVVQFDEKTKRFVPSGEHPDLDRTDLGTDVVEERDNRFLEDQNGAAQTLSHEEVSALKREKGVEGLLEHLVESSSTFASKTAFSQEKYIRKKKVKYAILFKLERVTPDNLAEINIPTISPSDQNPEESRFMKMRCDSIALLMHFAGVHSNARVLCYDKTNGALPAAILNRLATAAEMAAGCAPLATSTENNAGGIVYQVMDKTSHPNTVIARMMHLPDIKERWKAVPRNQPFLTGEDYAKSTEEDAAVAVGGEAEGEASEAPTSASVVPTSVSQWIRGQTARKELLESPADSLVIADDENPAQVVLDLLPFLALSGHLVVYTSFLDQLTEIFSLIRNDCVCIRISEAWYRHHQVLANRTHPTVNMSTAGGYLLTAIKVERNGAPRPRFAVITDEAHAKYNTGVSGGKKRPRDE